jgi:hypothetical protein
MPHNLKFLVTDTGRALREIAARHIAKSSATTRKQRITLDTLTYSADFQLNR